MSLLMKSGIIGFVDQNGIFCPDCWSRINNSIDESLNVFAADDVDELFEEIICDRCGEIIWSNSSIHRTQEKKRSQHTTRQEVGHHDWLFH